MAEVIVATGNRDTIEGHARMANATGLARGGDIAIAANRRFFGALNMLDGVNATRQAAAKALVDAHGGLRAEIRRNRMALLALRNAMWTVIGRPRLSPLMGLVFPRGVDMYTRVAPQKRPALMWDLAIAIREEALGAWTDELRNDWASQVDALREAFEKALGAEVSAREDVLVAEAARRSAILVVHGKLRAFKRDLLSMEMSQGQIHEIIPPAPRRASKAAKAPGEVQTTSVAGGVRASAVESRDPGRRHHQQADELGRRQQDRLSLG